MPDPSIQILDDLVGASARGQGLFYGPKGWIPKRRTFNALVELNGDGTTQDSALLNTLLQSTMSDGDTLEFPRGDYAIGAAQVTFSGKKLSLIFGPGARLVETVANINPLLYLNGCAQSELWDPNIAGIETNFIGAGSAQYGAYFHNCNQLKAGNISITGKSRGVLIDGAQRARIDSLDVQGLIHYTALNGAMDASQVSMTVTSTTNFPTTGTLKVENEQMTYTGKTGTTFTGLTRGANSTTAATHVDTSVVVEFFTTVNFHTSLTVIDCNHCVFVMPTGHDIGSVALQGNSGPIANAGHNSYIGVHGHNCFDNGVYLSSGNSCDVVAPNIQMDDGKRQTIGGSAVKLRGSRHGLHGGKGVGTYNGVVISGDSVANDAYGASGSGTTINGFIAYRTRGPGFNIPLNDGVVSNSPMRDVKFGACEAIECCQNAEAGVSSVYIVGGIGIDTSGIKVIDHAGAPTTSAAVMEAGTSGQHCQRNLIGGEIIWAPGATACASYRGFYADDSDLFSKLVNPPGFGFFLDHDMARPVVRIPPPINAAAAAATIEINTNSVTDAIIEVPIGATLIDSGIRTQPRWPKRKSLVITSTTAITTDYEHVTADQGSGVYNVLLPIANFSGKRSENLEITIYRKSSDAITVLRSGSDPSTVLLYNTANPAGVASLIIATQGGSITFKCIGATGWQVVSSQGTIT